MIPTLTLQTLPAAVLRAPTVKVGVFDAELAALITQMRTAMHAARGIGLAAPQVGLSKKLAVIEFDPKRFDDEDPGQRLTIPFFAIINPTITHYGQTSETLEEGCLSVPDISAPIARATEVHVVTFDTTGRRFRLRAKGLLARILQHEIDHLNGLLIVDRTTDKKIRKRFSVATGQ